MLSVNILLASLQSKEGELPWITWITWQS